jgi:hypothetical protein
VQVVERIVFRYLDPPPNRRIGLEKGDLELQDEPIRSSPRPSDGDLSDHGILREPILAKGPLAGNIVIMSSTESPALSTVSLELI